MTDPAATNPDLHVLEQLIAIFRRRWISILFFILAGLILAVLYGESQPPQYATSATVMVRSGFAADPVRSGIETSTPEEEGQFLSQLEYIRSSSVAALVASKLGLEQDADFARPPLSGYKRLIARAESLAGRRSSLAAANAPALDRDAVIARLQANVRALRSGRTYVAAISYQHADPAVAQKVAQAYAEAFRQKLAEANDMANSRARATIEAELAKATGEARTALEQKYQDMVISRALPGMDAVVISDAKKPVAPIAPRKSFLSVVGLVLGAALGCLFAGWRELRDRGVRDGDLLARRIGTRFLGYLPRLPVDRKPGTTGSGTLTVPDGARLTVEAPFSRFSETIRATAVAALANRKDGEARVIAVTSTLPGEGKTAFAANLAAHLGNQGRKVLLVDGDLRHPELSEWLAPGAGQGIIDTLLQGKTLAETGLFESRSNVTFLPAALNGRTVDPAGMFSGSALKGLIFEQKSQQDVIIFDLPSLTTAADARALAPLVESFILLAEWGGPSPAFIETLINSEPHMAAKLAGVVITKTELRKLPLYVTSASRGAYQKRIG